MAAADLRPFGVIERYREYLPLKPETVPATLGEGEHASDPGSVAQRRAGLRASTSSTRAVNPTGSFKDRA